MTTTPLQLSRCILILTAVLLASCTASYKTLTIETAKPSSDLLPDNIASLTLMNRSINDEFQSFDKDSLQKYFYKQGFDVNSVVLDSMASDTTLRVLGELLFESGRYDVVIPEERNLDRDIKFYRVPEELDWNEVQSICDEFETDALLVIERYYNKFMTRYTIHPDFMGNKEYVSASIDSKYDAIVKVYDPANQKIIRQLIVADTISWFDYDINTEKLFSKLPPIKDCLIQTGIQVALELDNRLSPTWVKEMRSYFVIGKDDVVKINDFANSNDWQGAYDYWLPFAGSANKTIKSHAEYNLALASEMLGQVDQSIEWANKSYYTKYHKQTENYLYKLKKRKETLLKFNELNQ